MHIHIIHTYKQYITITGIHTIRRRKKHTKRYYWYSDDDIHNNNVEKILKKKTRNESKYYFCTNTQYESVLNTVTITKRKKNTYT